MGCSTLEPGLIELLHNPTKGGCRPAAVLKPS